MRVDVFSTGFNLSAALRRYASTRAWLAVQQAATHLSWVGVRFVGEPAKDDQPRVTCQIDVWIRGGGLVSVRHIDTNPYVAVDCAGIRLRQALVSKLRDQGIEYPSRVVMLENHHSARSRLAILVTPAGRQPRLSLGPWLRDRYGIEELHAISLTGVEWDGLVCDSETTVAAERLKDRLALSLLGRPALIVVAGHLSQDILWNAWPRSRRDVRRIVERICSWELPVEVVGLWADEQWNVDECLVESEEVEAHARFRTLIPKSDATPNDERAWGSRGKTTEPAGRPIAMSASQ